MTSTAISAQGSVVSIGTGTGGAKTISGVAVGNPTVLTVTAHGFSNGDVVALAALTGADAASLNGLSVTVLYKTTNTIAVAIDTTGKTITAGAGTATPNTYTPIANVRDFSGLDGTASELDATNLSSTAKEIRLGIVDFGQFTMNVDHDATDGGQAACLAAYLGSTAKLMKVVLPNGSTASFTGYVKKFSLTGAVDALVKRAIDVRISGAVTWS